MSTFSYDARHARVIAAGGFTLIEVLVVIVILSISISLVVVNFTRDEQSLLEEDARRLALLLEFARDEAIVGGQPLAWTANLEGYTFARKPRGGRWQQVDADGMLVSRRWTQRSKLAGLRIAGVASAAGEPLVFTTSGINLPYEIVLAAGSWRVTLAGDYAGKVRVTRSIKDAAAAL